MFTNQGNNSSLLVTVVLKYMYLYMSVCMSVHYGECVHV